jgi:hypothetical protein
MIFSAGGSQEGHARVHDRLSVGEAGVVLLGAVVGERAEPAAQVIGRAIKVTEFNGVEDGEAEQEARVPPTVPRLPRADVVVHDRAGGRSG